MLVLLFEMHLFLFDAYLCPPPYNKELGYKAWDENLGMITNYDKMLLIVILKCICICVIKCLYICRDRCMIIRREEGSNDGVG